MALSLAWIASFGDTLAAQTSTPCSPVQGILFTPPYPSPAPPPAIVAPIVINNVSNSMPYNTFVPSSTPSSNCYYNSKLHPSFLHFSKTDLVPFLTAEGNFMTIVAATAAVKSGPYSVYTWSVQLSGATTASTTYLGSSIENVATPLGVQTPSAGASPTPNVPNSQSTLIYLPLSFFLAAGTSGPVNISVSYSNGAMSVSSDPYTISLCGRLASCNSNL